MLSVPNNVPLRLNCTWVTPTLSEAFAAKTIVPVAIVLFNGEDIETLGGVVSGGVEVEMLFTATLTGVEVAVFPAASLATAVREYVPLGVERVLQLML